MKSDTKELLISHLFDAPRAKVFKAWTDPEQLKHWYAPDGCSIEFKSIAVKRGGQFHYCIHDPVHGPCWIIGTYLEIIPDEKLVFTMVMSNEAGEAVSSVANGKVEDWPERHVATVIFESIGQCTKLTIHQTVSEEKAKETGAYQSWIKMFNKLNLLLQKKA
ncbi:MAG: SRPBCC domain-containing protein [Pedobacter sp.]|nr:SRPBCC domain-containing protein [Pedobacter sp.]MDQ8053215.1 SRPBCC domain-containing protein [Pedobacter sp.]